MLVILSAGFVSVFLIPLCCPLRRSHIWTVESSDPANRTRPDCDRPQQVRLELAVGGRYRHTCSYKIEDLNSSTSIARITIFTCWSERISNRRAVLSSEAETNAWPVGWNYNQTFINSCFWKFQVHAHFWLTYTNRVDIGVMAEESLWTLERPNVPQLDASIDGPGYDNVLFNLEWHGAHIPSVGWCLVDFLARFEIPDCKHHVTRASHNLLICNKSQISWQLMYCCF